MIIDIFSRYFLPNEKAEDYNAVIDGKNFFDQPVKIDIKIYVWWPRWAIRKTLSVFNVSWVSLSSVKYNKYF